MHKEDKSGRKWPWIIIVSILAVAGLSTGTVIIALNNPVYMSDINMKEYRDVDMNINDIIEQRVAFDAKYDVEYMTEQFSDTAAVVRFKVTDKSGNSVDNAEVNARLTRPDTDEYDIVFDAPEKVEAGVYTFKETTLPKVGRWNVLARIEVDGNICYKNLRADTRYANVYEDR